MSFQVACSRCHKTYEIQDTDAGRHAKCRCGERISLSPPETVSFIPRKYLQATRPNLRQTNRGVRQQPARGSEPNRTEWSRKRVAMGGGLCLIGCAALVVYYFRPADVAGHFRGLVDITHEAHSLWHLPQR